MTGDDHLATSASRPAISVIVPLFDDSARLQLCLAALRQQVVSDAYEVIVVDNGSTEELSGLKRDYPEVRWLFEACPGSYNARNTGIAAARGTILAFTDSDCQPRPDWLSAGVKALEDERIGFVGGRIDLITTSQRGLSAAELFDLAVGFPQRRFVEQVHFAMTANMLTRATIMRAVGPFDGRLKSGGDREWGNRAWSRGYHGCYAEDAAVRHPTRSTPPEVLKRIRRVAGGERDRHPGWARCLLFCARHLLPPRAAIQAIAAIDGSVATPVAKAKAAAFAYMTRIALIRDRIALQLNKGEAMRS